MDGVSSIISSTMFGVDFHGEQHMSERDSNQMGI